MLHSWQTPLYLTGSACFKAIRPFKYQTQIAFIINRLALMLFYGEFRFLLWLSASRALAHRGRKRKPEMASGRKRVSSETRGKIGTFFSGFSDVKSLWIIYGSCFGREETFRQATKMLSRILSQSFQRSENNLLTTAAAAAFLCQAPLYETNFWKSGWCQGWSEERKSLQG